MATLLVTAPQLTRAATLYWDQDGDTTTATGGTGTWTTGTQQWRNGNSTGTLQAWTDTAGTTDIADFAGTAGTVTLGLNLGALGLIFDTTGYTVDTSTFTLNLGTSGITQNVAATTIAGTLNLVGAQSWTNNGTTLTVNAATNNGGFLLTLAGSGAHAINGVISGAGGLTKTDAGTATLSGTNTYTGVTTVSAGTLSVNTLTGGSSNSSIGASSSGAGNLILNGGTLQYTGAAVTTNRLFTLQTSSTVDASGTGALNFNNTGSLGLTGSTAARSLTLTGTNTNANTLAAKIANSTGATAVTKSGAGLWVLSGNNTYTGATTVNAGTLRAGVATVTGTSGAFGNNSAVTIANTAGAVLSLNGFNQSVSTLTGGGTTGGEVSLGSATLTLTSSGSQVFAGLVSGTGGLVVNKTVSGGSAQTLSGPNTYSGGTVINNGFLLAGSNTALGSGAVTISTGTGQLRLGDSVNVANTLNMNGGTGNSGTGQLIYAGGLSTTYSGPINITASPGAGGLFASTSGGTLNLTGAITSSVDVSIRLGIVSFSNTANSFNTMSVTGTAKIGANNALPTGVTVNLAASDSGTLDLAGYNQTISGLTLATATNTATVTNSVAATTSTLTTTGTSTFAGVIANGAGTTALTVNGGTLTLTGTNTYTGTTVINGGTALLTGATTGTSGVVLNAGSLQLGNNDRINNAATVTLNGGTLNLNTRSEGAAGTSGVGALTLTATSTLDFGATGNANLIQFAGLGTQTDGTVLQVVNWEGTAGSANGTDRLLFAGSATDFNNLYSQNEVSFNGGTGYGVTQFGGFYEVFGITAVPEPSTYLSGLLLVGLTSNILWRRRARSTIHAQRV